MRSSASRAGTATSIPDTVAGTIFHAFTIVFAEAVVRAAVHDDELVERWLNKSGVALFEVVSSPWRFQERLLTLWDEGDPAWFGGRTWDDVALEALEKALDGLEERFGRDPAKWRWGRVHNVEFSHPFGRGERGSSGGSSTARSRPAEQARP